jgi:hypothetical protein
VFVGRENRNSKTSTGFIMGKNVVGRNGTVTGLRVRELDASELASAVGGQANGALSSGRHTKRREEREHAAKTREEREHAAKTREERSGGFLRWLIGN